MEFGGSALDSESEAVIIASFIITASFTAMTTLFAVTLVPIVKFSKN